jgi:hypothetical protein
MELVRELASIAVVLGLLALVFRVAAIAGLRRNSETFYWCVTGAWAIAVAVLLALPGQLVEWQLAVVVVAVWALTFGQVPRK